MPGTGTDTNTSVRSKPDTVKVKIEPDDTEHGIITATERRDDRSFKQDTARVKTEPRDDEHGSLVNTGRGVDKIQKDTVTMNTGPEVSSTEETPADSSAGSEPGAGLTVKVNTEPEFGTEETPADSSGGIQPGAGLTVKVKTECGSSEEWTVIRCGKDQDAETQPARQVDVPSTGEPSGCNSGPGAVDVAVKSEVKIEIDVAGEPLWSSLTQEQSSNVQAGDQAVTTTSSASDVNLPTVPAGSSSVVSTLSNQPAASTSGSACVTATLCSALPTSTPLTGKREPQDNLRGSPEPKRLHLWSDLDLKGEAGSDLVSEDELDSDLELEDEAGSDLELEDEAGSDLELGDEFDSDLELEDVTGSDLELEDEAGSDLKLEDEAGSDLELGDEFDSDLELGDEFDSDLELEDELDSDLELEEEAGSDLEEEAGSDLEEEAGSDLEEEAGSDLKDEAGSDLEGEADSDRGPFHAFMMRSMESGFLGVPEAMHMYTKLRIMKRFYYERDESSDSEKDMLRAYMKHSIKQNTSAVEVNEKKAELLELQRTKLQLRTEIEKLEMRRNKLKREEEKLQIEEKELKIEEKKLKLKAANTEFSDSNMINHK